MAGNSQRKGAIRKPGTKKGQVVGSGGRRKRGLEGKGPTPKAADRPAHPAARRAAKAQSGAGNQGAKRGPGSGGETVAGRNPVAEAMRAGVPATAVYVAERIDADDRVRDIVRLAADRDLPLMEVPRAELDRLTRGATHQGVAVTVPAYDYAHPGDLLDAAHESGQAPLVVALDGVTDARNLGAIVRSAAAFGAHGVLVPKRRSAGMTAGAWKTSAGAAAHLPVAQATNLARELRAYQEAGVFVIGLDGSGDTPITDEAATDLFAGPVCLVAGSEGKGLSQVVASACDLVVNIPMAGTVESLNAGVATSVALYEAARARNDHVHHP